MNEPLDRNVLHISNLIESQFPSFYREQGPNFIAFVKAFYEFLEQREEVIGQIGSLIYEFDIDTATADFLKHYKEKFMSGLPDELLGNQVFLHKHILDLYRSKGSIEGVKLLFRLLFNEDIDLYVPSYDIFKLSDNTWVEPRYFEVTDSPFLSKMNNAYVWGNISKASAIVESYEHKLVNGTSVYLLFISSIQGEFQVGEYIMADFIDDQTKAPRILGSPEELTVVSSVADFKIGDILEDTDITKENPLQAIVTNVYDSFGNILFTIEDGGDYYSLDAVVNITAGSNTSGHGADFVVSGISNVADFTYSEEKLLPYINVPLVAAAYGFPGNPTANANTVIAEALNLITIQVGTISDIIVTNPGIGYDGDVDVKVIDPNTSTRGIYISPTEIGGMNAVITGKSMEGLNLIGKAKVYKSSYGYLNGVIQLRNTAANNMTATFNMKVGGVGVAPGYFDNNKSFASSNKYLFDGHYYQDFSYEVLATRNLETYAEYLKRIAHPTSNALFGRYSAREINSMDVKELHTSVSQRQQTTQGLTFNFITNTVNYRTATTNFTGNIH